MADQYDLIVKGFTEAILHYPPAVVSRLNPDVARETGRRAARAAVAPALWQDVLGDSLETAQVTDLLKISRQAISKKVAAGTLIGIRGTATTFFPSWQFDLERGVIRPEIRQVTAVFAEELGAVDMNVVVSWASTEQHEDLGGETPAALIAKGTDIEQVVRSARRLAEGLAS